MQVASEGGPEWRNGTPYLYLANLFEEVSATLQFRKRQDSPRAIVRTSCLTCAIRSRSDLGEKRAHCRRSALRHRQRLKKGRPLFAASMLCQCLFLQKQVECHTPKGTHRWARAPVPHEQTACTCWSVGCRRMAAVIAGTGWHTTVESDDALHRWPKCSAPATKQPAELHCHLLLFSRCLLSTMIHCRNLSGVPHPSGDFWQHPADQSHGPARW